MRRSCDLDFIAASVEAFRRAAAGEYLERTRMLIPLVQSRPELHAVWMQETHEAPAALIDAVAQRLRIEPDSPHAVLAATTVRVAAELALRHAVERDADAVELFAAYLSIVDRGLLAPAPTQPAPARDTQGGRP